MLHWFFYNEFEDVQEKAPTKVPNHDKLVDTQTTLWASLTIRRTNVHLDSCSLTIAHALLPAQGITVVLSLLAHASQMACFRIDCGAQPIGRSLLCALYYLNHASHPTHPSNGPVLYAVSPQISERNCTSWQ